MKKRLLALVLVALLVQAAVIAIIFTNPLFRRSPEPCRKSHVIYGAAGAGTNYQIRIKVHYGSGTDSGEDVYLNHNVRMDFGDVRFTADDGVTELDYWIEEKVDGDHAVFWVEVSTDLSSQSQTIYIYYGNNNAPTTSNGADTFIFFDPCDNLDQWTKYTSGDGDVTIVDGTFKFYASAGSTNKEMIKSPLLGSANIAISYKLKWVSPNSYTWRQWLTPEDPTAPYECMQSHGYVHGFMDEEHPSYPNRHTMIVGGVSYEFSVDIGYRDAGQWDLITLKSKSGKQVIIIDDTVEDTGTVTHTWNDVRIVMEGGQSWTTAHERYVDDIRVRKFVDPEPTHGAWGAEEAVE